MNFSYWESQFLSTEADLIIIGAGITGMSTAYHAAKSHPNWKIIILEKHMHSAASTRNAGFACFGSAGEIMDDLNSGVAKDEVLKTIEMRITGLKLLRETLGDDGLDLKECGGFELFDINQEKEYEHTLANLEPLNNDIQHITGSPRTFTTQSVPKALSNYTHAIYNHLEGKLNPGKMMKSWEKLCSDVGIKIYRGYTATLCESNTGVCFGNHLIKCSQVAICTNGLSKSLGLGLEVKPARNLVLMTKPLPSLNLPSTYHHKQGYIYFRKENERLLIGGARYIDPETEFSDEFVVNQKVKSFLVNYLNSHFNIQPEDIEYEWLGIMGVSGSKKPLIGRINDQAVYGVKLGGMGVAIGSLVGKKVAELLN